ncbi:MAG: enoyl-CoA hydratase/isomerase family protein [Rhodospirillaceae bacterium]
MDYTEIAFDVRPDGIATMTLNRPERLNSFTRKMFDEWRDVTARCAFSDDIRVLVVTGAGRAFSSGVDLTMLGSDHLQPPAFRYYYRQAHQAFDDIEALEIPVIAAINGLCYGGGVELALSCDITLAAGSATFCLVENQLGAIPASGACNRMIHHVGLGKTKELIISADPIDAGEARRIGLVGHVYDDGGFMDAVYDYAGRLLKNSPFAMGMAKHVVNMCVNTDMHTGRDIERLAQSVLVLSEDHKEGMAAFFEKRKPHFRGK